MDAPKPLVSFQHLLFEAPLYVKFQVPAGKFGKGDNLRGYCPRCKDDSIFKVVHKPGVPIIPVREAWAEVNCRCVQHDDNVLRFWLRIEGDVVEKWGQYPSTATVAQGEVKRLRKGLDRRDAQELGRAVGLASVGVGIGSFVYIRRVFERVIDRKFQELKAQAGWDDDALKGKRGMDQRIELMAPHLPDFLVKNQRFYSILSKGIHELDEEDCLAFFDVAYTSIKFILDDDLRKREEAAERRQAEIAIANYKPPSEPIA